jgi:mono/diheme cytochrome c family protein
MMELDRSDEVGACGRPSRAVEEVSLLNIVRLACGLSSIILAFTAIASEIPSTNSNPPDAKQMAAGEAIAKTTCELCHGSTGQGDVGPPLRQNLADIRGVVKAITEGKGEMPAFAEKFSDHDIADVLTFVRNSWGNSYGAVSEQQVAAVRH